MGRVRDWQDWKGQRGPVLEVLLAKTMDNGLAWEGDLMALRLMTHLASVLGPTTNLLKTVDTELSNTNLAHETSHSVAQALIQLLGKTKLVSDGH